MRKISADFIVVGTGIVLAGAVLTVDESGKIMSIDEKKKGESSEHYAGMIIPGLINTHCHMELSHMKGLIPTGTGLIEFISQVVKYRDFDQEVIDRAIVDADAEMFRNGIQAVGDICNKLDTRDQKNKSAIAYYSFVEMFDFMNPDMTDQFSKQYQEVYDGQAEEGDNKKSMVPHAPYTVSQDLFDYLSEANTADKVISIHNQETPAENELFMKNTGAFLKFYEDIGMPLETIPTRGVNSLIYALANMDPRQKTILVHNTMTTDQDIKDAQDWSDKIYWASCPNANLYIENNLPDYKTFINNDCKMTLGTDSLSSNWQLSIWEEMKTIAKYNSYLNFDQLIQWATINGAEALGYQDKLGSIEIGKTPGLIHIDLAYIGTETNIQGTQPKRIV